MFIDGLKLNINSGKISQITTKAIKIVPDELSLDNIKSPTPSSFRPANRRATHLSKPVTRFYPFPFLPQPYSPQPSPHLIGGNKSLGWRQHCEHKGARR